MPRYKRDCGKNGQKSYDSLPLRTGGRVKKAKIVFDPSVNNMPKRRGGRTFSVSSSMSDNKSGESPPKQKKIKATYCNPIVYENFKKEHDSKSNISVETQSEDCCKICEKVDMKTDRIYVSCKSCNMKVHATCLDIKFQDISALENGWRCNTCRSCAICYESTGAGYLITCCQCVESYHFNCHDPKLIEKEVSTLKWLCHKCCGKDKISIIPEEKVKTEDEADIKIDKNTSEHPKVECESSTIKNEKLQQSNEAKFKFFDNETQKIDYEIPDISDWSCERVCKYFEIYFPSIVDILKEQEIDGAAILLMRRSDVVGRLPIKLGQALRLYSIIVMLQTKCNDPTLTWM